MSVSFVVFKRGYLHGSSRVGDDSLGTQAITTQRVVSVQPVCDISKRLNDHLIGQESLLNGSFFLSPKAKITLIVVCTSTGRPRNI